LTSTVGAPSSAAIRSTAAATCSALLTSDRERPAAGGGDLLDGVLARRLLQVHHGHGEAVGGEADRGGGADAAGRAGDDGYAGVLLSHDWCHSFG
jgi:hypothetical protein